MEKKHLEAKGVRVNIRKTKILIWSENLHSFKDLGKHLCEVCRKGIVSNSISVMNVDLGYTRNAVVLKVSRKVIQIIDAKNVWGFAD